MLDLDKNYVSRLLHFYYVATCKNISHGAREAGLHQSAMSRQMIALERELGISLMTRHSEGVRLTRKGEELFAFSKKIFSDVQASRKQLEENDDISGKIRLTTTHAILNYILGEHLIRFNELYPAIHLDIVCDDYVIDLVKNEVDVAIRVYDSDTPNIIQEPLFKLQGKLYASQEYIEQYGFPETAADLSGHKFIVWSRSYQLPFNIPVDRFLRIEGYTSNKNCIMNVNSIEMMFRAAQRGKGIIPAHENMEILKNSGLINVAPSVKGPEQQDYFVYSDQLKDYKRVQLLKNYLKEVL